MNIIERNVCPICVTNIESIEHAFLECNSMILLWNKIEQWVKSRTSQTVKLSHVEKIFGRQTSEELLEKIIISAKTVIFNNRKNGRKHHINDVKRMLFKQLCIEEYQATLSSNLEKLSEVWGPIYDELYNTYSNIR